LHISSTSKNHTVKLLTKLGFEMETNRCGRFTLY
jgi:hypothetical protein